MNKFGRGIAFWIVILLLILYFNYLSNLRGRIEDISYSRFKELLRNEQLIKVEVGDETIEGVYRTESGEKKRFRTTILNDPTLVKELEEHDVLFTAKKSNRFLSAFFFNFGPFILIILVWYLIARSMRVGGREALSFGKSRARVHMDMKGRYTFKDVAGCDEAKEELMEIVEFLKDPKKFQRLGGRIPKGVLLYGPPGTGKTLLAKAVAGEAGVPFFSVSGSEFVEMFVGVGAARVRDLFEKGRKHAPCLLFIDEIDAVGRQRFAGIGGGHDEREQTLNQLLVEMDGFDTREGVVLIAATNRPDVLDPALLRPGRFDRRIHVPPPDIKGREAILKIHAKKIKLSPNVDLSIIARRTPGFVGSDLENLINEAALLAARKNKNAVEMDDLEEAIDRVLAGPERKSRVISEREKKIVAYHEAGHALVAYLIPDTDPIHKISIIPRGPALGYTLQLPTEDRYLSTERELKAKITVLLGGRVAEELVFKEITTGAQNDLLQATKIAHRMVTSYGMSKRLGSITFKDENGQVFLGRDLLKMKEYSEKTQELIDKEIKRLVEMGKRRARLILMNNFDKLKKLAEALMEREVLEADEVKEILEGGNKDEENKGNKENEENKEDK
ncbi:MAG: cell division protein FtsH [Caldiserica bacterium]|nr:MAG: cell division protein FtsH [Caldisericota bacterium]